MCMELSKSKQSINELIAIPHCQKVSQVNSMRNIMSICKDKIQKRLCDSCRICSGTIRAIKDVVVVEWVKLLGRKKLGFGQKELQTRPHCISACRKSLRQYRLLEQNQGSCDRGCKNLSTGPALSNGTILTMWILRGSMLTRQLYQGSTILIELPWYWWDTRVDWYDVLDLIWNDEEK